LVELEASADNPGRVREIAGQLRQAIAEANTFLAATIEAAESAGVI
jgi:hypothetical protein